MEGYASSSFTEEIIEDEDVTSKTIPDLITWRRYEIQVAAWNGAGTGPYSESVRVRTNEGGKFLEEWMGRGGAMYVISYSLFNVDVKGHGPYSQKRTKCIPGLSLASLATVP